MPFLEISTLEEKEIIPGFFARMIHTERMTVVYLTVEAGSALQSHAHPHEQVTTILEGEFEMTLGEEKKVLTPGKSAVIPSQVPHSGRAISACRLVDVFSPAREDYK